VARAKAGLRDAEATAAAIGVDVLAACGVALGSNGRDFDGGDGINDCGVHFFPFGGVAPPHCCNDVKTKELRIV